MADTVVIDFFLGRATRYKWGSRLAYVFNLCTPCRGSALFSSITFASNAFAPSITTLARTEIPCAPINWAKTAKI